MFYRPVRQLLFAFAFLISSSALAESQVFKVTGMHCPDCAATAQTKLCKSAKFKVCKVRLLDEKNEIGEVQLETADGQKIDMTKVAGILEHEGYPIQK